MPSSTTTTATIPARLPPLQTCCSRVMDGVSQQPAQAAPLCANAAAAPVSSSTPPRPNPVRVEALKAAIEHIQTKREQLERVPRPPWSPSAAEPVSSKPWVFCDGDSAASDDADVLFFWYCSSCWCCWNACRCHFCHNGMRNRRNHSGPCSSRSQWHTMLDAFAAM